MPYLALFGELPFDRYLIRIPKRWDHTTGPRPIVFIHGLGLGLLQYSFVFSHLLETLSDRPLLFLLQPQISQDILHPNYLKPMTRHQTADSLAGLLRNLGWVHSTDSFDDEAGEDSEGEIADALLDRKRTGVTLVSHSK
jgi:hypothetical protein